MSSGWESIHDSIQVKPNSYPNPSEHSGIIGIIVCKNLIKVRSITDPTLEASPDTAEGSIRE